MRRLQNRRAVVTGGSGGIGRAIALGFAREGADVLFTAYSGEDAAAEIVDCASTYGVRLGYIKLDGNAPDSAARLLDAATEFHGRVDILVNNAAVTTRTRFLDINTEEYDRVMNVNLRFPFFTLQAFARHMKDNGITGSIIQISSISASKAVSAMAHYQCSKAALTMLTRSAAFELAPYGIRVNTISPGLTATNANRNQWRDDPALWKDRGKDIPLGRTGMPSDHAGAAIFLASDESSWMTGADLVVDGGEAVV